MPEVIRIRVLLFGSWVLLGSPAIVLLVLFRKRIIRASQQKPAWWNIRAQSLIPMLAWIHLFLLVMYAIFGPAGTRSLGNGGIEILHREQVGVNDVHVISADTPEPILEWLREHDFAFSPDDAAVFQAYLDSGWVFVAARLKPPADTPEPFIHMRGFAAPLVMHFPTGTPVYPMALTGTVGESTEVLLYLITETPVKDHSNIPLQFAGESFPIRRFPGFPETAQPWPHPGYLYKFHGKLASEDMREDFFFHSAESFKPQGRRIVRW